MKRIVLSLTILALLTILSASITGYAEQLDSGIPNKTATPTARTLKASGINWKGRFGSSKAKPDSVYCLMGSGFFRAPTSPDFESLISQWLTAHPDATVVEVNSFGPVLDNNPNSIMVYVWVVDLTGATLNEHLVRQGGCPGGTMAIPDLKSMLKLKIDPVPKQSHGSRARSAPRAKSAQKSASSTPTNGNQPEMLVTQAEYERFIAKIVAAERDARQHRRGIWRKGGEAELL